MDIVLSILGWTAFALAVLLGIGLNAVGLFGNWVLVAAIAGLWVARGFEHYSLLFFVLLLALAALGELLEFLAASYGASRFGGSRRATLTIIAGCVAGAVFGSGVLPVVGSVLGAFVGAFVAAAAYEYIVMERRAGHAALAGLGAVVGKVGGIVAKLAIGFVILSLAFIFY